MNGYTKFYFIYILSLLILVGCTSKNDTQESRGMNQEEPQLGSQKKIIVYGSMNCVHCHQFRRQLDSKGIKYEFKDVDANDNYFHELQTIIKSINYKGYVQYPVIDIEGEIFVNPKFKEVEKKMFNKPTS